MNKFTKANGKKLLNSCNPFLDTFRTISRTGTKLQIAPTIIIAMFSIIEQHITSPCTDLQRITHERASVS
jgi:hypothetical protein